MYTEVQVSTMGENIEIKARARDVGRQREIAAQICDSGPELLEQTDTFFNVQAGRLKLREFASGDAELLQYERPNRTEPSKSRYSIVPISSADALKEALGAALGILGVVRKNRYLYMVGQTRIHFDEVADLGDFIELEVVLSPGQTDEDGAAITRTLMQRLEIREADLIDRAYVDMLSK
ncbi:MAG: class IV adenylate cyclase [Phycisphaerales bacterium]|nr:MAG: class IV adenylate cyclase [Phycisphaerales bacterium]